MQQDICHNKWHIRDPAKCVTDWEAESCETAVDSI